MIGPDEALTPEQVATGHRRLPRLVHRPRQVEGGARVLRAHGLPALPAPSAVRPDVARPQARLHRALLRHRRRRAPAARPRFGSSARQCLFGAQQMAIIGYYADPRTAGSTGYVPFSKRKRYAKVDEEGRQAGHPRRERAERGRRRPRSPPTWRSSAAAPPARCSPTGSPSAGREVVLLEGGKHVNPRDFTEDERVQFSNLYSDGGHADVDGRPLPGPAGQVRGRQHRRQQRRLLRHPAAHSAALERPGWPRRRHRRGASS